MKLREVAQLVEHVISASLSDANSKFKKFHAADVVGGSSPPFPIQ